MTTAVVSYIYPNVLAYLPAFLQSLSLQTEQDFELLIFNDGVQDAENYFKDCDTKYRIFPVEGNQLEIRFRSLQLLATTTYSKFIFQDADDLMSVNRVAKCKELLHHYPFVCNDLVLTNERGDIISDASWSARLQDGFVFDHSFIADKNIAGLGNSAIHKSLLETPIKFNNSPLAPDWFIFYQLLYLSGTNAVFTTSCQTLYRQHANNSAGLKKVDDARLKHVINVCKMHYTGLTKTGYTLMNEQLSFTLRAEGLLKNNNYNYVSPVRYENLYWWEEKNYLYEKN